MTLYMRTKILYLLIKESGVVVHSDDKGTKDTLLERMQSYPYKKANTIPKTNTAFSPSFCNRLDRNTSGIIIGAKNSAALRIINEKIRSREIKKDIPLHCRRSSKKAVTLPHILHAVTKSYGFRL